MLPRFGSYRLGRPPADEIENWLNDDVAAGRAPSSVHRHYRTLRRMLQVPRCERGPTQQHMWQRMLAKIEDFRAGDISLHQLVDDIRGLYVEADPHDSQVGDEFEEYWSALDIELAQRTEPWAPAGAATEQSLRVAVGDFEWWVKKVLGEHALGEHALGEHG